MLTCYKLLKNERSLWYEWYTDSDNDRDRFSIFDDVIKKALPKYLKMYNIKAVIKSYQEYNKAIGQLLNEVKIQKKEVLSRNGFDQLVWYYHR